MNRTDIQNQLETIQGCIETFCTVYRNFEDFGGSADICIRDSLCEITFIVQAQQEIIKGLVDAISISSEEQEIERKIVELRRTFETFDENEKDHDETRRDFLFSYLYMLGRLNRSDEKQMQLIDILKRRTHGA